jgi:hypothetical protein
MIAVDRFTALIVIKNADSLKLRRRCGRDQKLFSTLGPRH